MFNRFTLSSSASSGAGGVWGVMRGDMGGYEGDMGVMRGIWGVMRGDMGVMGGL